MPYSSVSDLPPAFKNLSPKAKAKGLSVLNALLRDNPDQDEGKSIRIAIAKAKMYAGESLDEEEEEILAECNMFDIKAEKVDAKYRMAKEGSSDVCGQCRHYSYGSCAIVEGHIEASYTCDYYRDPLPSQVNRAVHERTFTSDQRKSMASKGQALPDGSYPIENVDDLKNAIQAFGRSGNPAATKRHIIKRARALGKSDLIPDSWKEGEDDMTKVSFSVHENISIAEQIGGSVWEVICIAPGLSKNRTYYSEQTLQDAAPLFEGVKVFADHRDGPRSVREVVGWMQDAKHVTGRGVVANFHCLETQEWFAGPFAEAFERGKTDLIGFSINGSGVRNIEKRAGQNIWNVESINHIDSVDGVINPSAGGQVVKLVAGEGEEDDLMDLKTLEEFKEAHPDLYDKMQAEMSGKTREEVERDLVSLKEAEDARIKEEEDKEAAEKAAEEARRVKEEEDKNKDANTRIMEQMEEAARRADEAATRLEETQKKAASAQVLRSRLQESNLPDAVKLRIERSFVDKIFTDEELENAMKEEEDYLKKLNDERPNSYISMGEGQQEKALKALDGLLAGEDVDGVPAAKSLKEAYATFKGIPSWQGIDAYEVLRESYNSGLQETDDPRAMRLREALVSTTWSFAFSDRIHKRLLALYNTPYLSEWRLVCSSIVPIIDFKTQRRVRTGGYGKFNTVAEGATYSPVSSPTDQEATYVVTKYGGTESLTIEAIANDDVNAVRRIPQQLADAQKRTIYETVMNLIFTNALVSYDLGNLINHNQTGTHSNSVAGAAGGTNDVALADGSLAEAKRLMAVQTELNSAKKLGLVGKYLLYPPDLDPIAKRLRDNEYAVSAAGAEGLGAATPTADRYRDINVHRSTIELLRVPYWTDAAAWFLVADPNQVPTIEAGFYQGREEPELFVQDMPNVGSMFDADKLTYKSRLIFGAAVLDHRGFVGSSRETRSAP